MRAFYYTILFCFIASFAFSQSILKKQVFIPFNNDTGVPYTTDEELNDMVVSGFDVDSKGNYYFFGGSKSGCLAVFSITTQKFRKVYADVPASSLFVFKDSLYTYYKSEGGENSLLKIDIANGTILKKCANLSNKYVHTSQFIDSSLVIGYYGSQSDSLKEQYAAYSLLGKYKGEAVSLYNVPKAIFPDKSSHSFCELVGYYNGNYVFWSIPDSKFNLERLWLIKKDGAVIATVNLPGDFAGDAYADNPRENRKVRNGKFYIMGKKGRSCIITEIPLSNLFKGAN
jgi:hypothetical protein